MENVKYECAKCSEPVNGKPIKGWKCPKCKYAGMKFLKGTPERKAMDRMENTFNDYLNKK